MAFVSGSFGFGVRRVPEPDDAVVTRRKDAAVFELEDHKNPVAVLEIPDGFCARRGGVPDRKLGPRTASDATVGQECKRKDRALGVAVVERDRVITDDGSLGDDDRRPRRRRSVLNLGFDLARGGGRLFFVRGRGYFVFGLVFVGVRGCLLYTSPSPRDATLSRMPSSA